MTTFWSVFSRLSAFCSSGVKLLFSNEADCRVEVTLRRLLTNVKDKEKPEDRQGAVYKIKCCDCQASYIGETGRNLSTRLTEHKRATRNGDVNNHIAEHHLKTKHQIDCDMYNVFYRLLSTSYFRKLVY